MSMLNKRSIQITATAWGETENRIEIKVLKKYEAVLLKFANLGEVCIHLLVWSLAILIVCFIFTQDFEKIIFNDGSENSCVLNTNGDALKDGK